MSDGTTEVGVMRRDRRAVVAAVLLTLLSSGCAPQVLFMQVGDETYPAHPEEHEIVVFFGMDRPERDYRVIGMLYIEENVNSWDDDWVRHLQQAARRHGADAILDVRTPEAKGVFLEASTSQMEAKAIVFVDEP